MSADSYIFTVPALLDWEQSDCHGHKIGGVFEVDKTPHWVAYTHDHEGGDIPHDHEDPDVSG